jgi:hypothetical protein
MISTPAPLKRDLDVMGTLRLGLFAPGAVRRGILDLI